jgi:hypothetical protein
LEIGTDESLGFFADILCEVIPRLESSIHQNWRLNWRLLMTIFYLIKPLPPMKQPNPIRRILEDWGFGSHVP